MNNIKKIITIINQLTLLSCSALMILSLVSVNAKAQTQAEVYLIITENGTCLTRENSKAISANQCSVFDEAQKWRVYSPYGDERHIIASIDDKKCLMTNHITRGSKAILINCNPADGHRPKFALGDNLDSTEIKHVGSAKLCVFMPKKAKKQGAMVSCNNNPNQRFTFFNSPPPTFNPQ